MNRKYIETPARPTAIPAVDATHSLRIKISADDRDAIQCSPTHCVFANAINRLPGYTNAHVGATMVYVEVNGVPTRYAIERNGIAMIRAYDNDATLIPEGVQLDLQPPKPKSVGAPRMRSSKQLASAGSKAPRAVRRPSHRSIFVEPKEQLIYDYDA